MPIGQWAAATLSARSRPRAPAQSCGCASCAPFPSERRVSLFVVVALATYLNPLRLLTKLPINIDNLVVSGTKVTMEAPRLSGFTSDARAYELTADTAAQDMTKPDMVELHNIRAKVEMQDKSMMELTAISGARYDSKGRTAEARSRHQRLNTSGYRARLS